MSFFLRRFIFIKHTKKQGGYIMRENIKTGIKYLALFGMCFLGGRSLAAGQTVRVDGEKPCRLAILIDDFGYCGAGTEEMLALSIPFTAAVMPFSSCTAEDAERVRQAGKEIFIHMPMESLTGKREWVGEKGIFRDMEDAAIRERVEEAFSALPDAAGMNNHMGSAIMEDARSLSAVMEVLKGKGVPFVDSMTTAKSLGKAVARGKGRSPSGTGCVSGQHGFCCGCQGQSAQGGRDRTGKGGCDCHWACRPRRRKNYGTGNQRGCAGAGAGRHYLCDRQ